jgi:hypothetical protein
MLSYPKVKGHKFVFIFFGFGFSIFQKEYNFQN